MLKIKTRFFSINKRYELLGFGAGVSARRNLNRLFKIRDSIFFKKKLPESENYPYSVIDPFEVFGEDHPYGDFNLVGEDWKDKSNAKPLAILWGFNNWKLGFVSAYLPEYRTAFAPRKIRGLLALLAIRRFPIKPSVFIFWGYTEPNLVRKYAELNEIKILRMEDGFLRSSALGATHSTPYSLLLDSRGMHYNPDASSELEEILNTYEFSEDELKVAEECMELFKDLRLSKYNPASLGVKNGSGIKTRRRVAVLGQVDNDMAMRLGNPDGWTMNELVKLAKIENPDADVYYRPHPDVYKGIQRSRFRLKAVEKYCKLASPDVPLVDFLDTLDQVYTVTSLSGLEALLRGVKVTVVGSAFYAGWGLTDDRLVFPNRVKLRSLLELFAAVYLKYPIYLANVKNTEIGFKTACFRIRADLEVNEYNLFNELNIEPKENRAVFAASDYWPMLVFKKLPQNGMPCCKKTIGAINFTKTIGVGPGKFFQIGLLYAVSGACADNDARDVFIGKIFKYIDKDILNQLLIDLNKIYPGPYITKYLALLLSENGENECALDLLAKRTMCDITATQVKKEAKEQGLGFELKLSHGVEERLLNGESENKYDVIILKELFDRQFQSRPIGDALHTAKELLLRKEFVSELLLRLSQIAALSFDNRSSKSLADLLTCVDTNYGNGIPVMLSVKAYDAMDFNVNELSFKVSLIKLVAIRPDLTLLAILTAGIEGFEELIANSLSLTGDISIQKANGYIALNRPEIAVEIVEKVIRSGIADDKTLVAYSQALSYAGRISEARVVMKSARSLNKTSSNFRESLRLCVLSGSYEEGLRLVEEARLYKIIIGDMLPRKIYFGSRMVKEAFKMFTEIKLNKLLKAYYKNKYLKSDDLFSGFDHIFMLALYGPGDEIRFSCIYNLIANRLPQIKISLSCSPRLKTMFERSFPKFTFIPVDRPRSSDPIDLKNYSMVPGSDLIGVVDNNAVKEINSADKIMLVTDMLHECLGSYKDFPGHAYLTCNINLYEIFKSMLPNNKLLIGLSWRSSLTTHSRNEHYLSIEELDPIFKIDELQFVNFQYDECQGELDWVEARYPGKLINISEIDQYNDFESVAALMKCMDLMIAPATTVVELSGALGCPTWLLSNSSELCWRKIDEEGTDVWHRTITHVEGKVLGDKESLVAELCVRLSKLPKKANFQKCN